MEHDSPSPPDSLYTLDSLLPQQQDPKKFNGAEAFGNALSTFFKHPIVLCALFIIPAILWEYFYKIYELRVLLFVVFGNIPSRANEIAFLFGGGILYFALQTFTMGVAAIIVQRRLANSPLRISQAMSGAAKRLPAALVLSCIFYVILMAYLAVIFSIFINTRLSMISILLLMPPIAIPFLYFLVRWSVAMPACILEATGPFKSLRRSSQLTAGSKLKIVAFYITLTVLTILLSKIIGAVGSVTGNGLRLAISIASGVIISTIVFICPAAIYLELRRAKEYTPPPAAPESSVTNNAVPEAHV